MQKRHTSRKRLLNAAHEPVNLRTRQPECARHMMLVHMDLDIAKKFGRILYFINDDGRFVELQKQLRVILSHIACIQIVQRHIPSPDPLTRGKLFEHRRLARLSRPRDEQRRKELA